MTTNFVWVREGESFDSRIHNRCDLDILELTIDHREGEVALATVVVPQLRLPPWDQRHVFISHGETLLFSGRLVGLPVEFKNDLLSLELTAESLESVAQLHNMAKELKQHPYWDSSFADPMDQENPAEWLEARSALFAWDRVSGTVCLSDLFQGRQMLDYTNLFFADSLKICLAETPLSSITVNLTVEWVQKAEGEVNLSSKIAAAFPGGIINTLTPHALEASWPKEGQKMGRTGYWVAKSDLKSIKPPQTGILGLYPTVTPELKGWDESTKVPKAMQAQRFWMSGTLVLGWRYQQKRREIVRFTLAHKTQLEGRIHPLTRHLNLRLQQIVPQEDGTFFLSARGRQAVEHAIEIARAHLAASARCLEVEMTLPFEAGFPLSMDHSVRLVDSRIPGGEVTGKVIAYQLFQDGLKSHTWIRLVASIGETIKELPAPSYTYYVVPDYGDTALPEHHETISGLGYANYAQQRPIEGVVETKDLSSHDIVPDVLVSHDAQRQIHILQSQQYPVCHDIKSILQEIPTVISLDLLNLKTKAVAEHTIYLNILNAWTAPNQVTLTGETL